MKTVTDGRSKYEAQAASLYFDLWFILGFISLTVSVISALIEPSCHSFHSEITLKILAHNNLIGRIIGKGGNTIKRIMQDTDTKITVSSINDINSFNLERIITVKGTIENMSKAESMISSKLRQSYENDLQAMAVSFIMRPSLYLGLSGIRVNLQKCTGNFAVATIGNSHSDWCTSKIINVRIMVSRNRHVWEVKFCEILSSVKYHSKLRKMGV